MTALLMTVHDTLGVGGQMHTEVIKERNLQVESPWRCVLLFSEARDSCRMMVHFFHVAQKSKRTEGGSMYRTITPTVWLRFQLYNQGVEYSLRAKEKYDGISKPNTFDATTNLTNTKYYYYY